MTSFFGGFLYLDRKESCKREGVTKSVLHYISTDYHRSVVCEPGSYSGVGRSKADTRLAPKLLDQSHRSWTNERTDPNECPAPTLKATSSTLQCLWIKQDLFECVSHAVLSCPIFFFFFFFPFPNLPTQTHRISGDGRGWVDEMSVPFFSLNGSSYIAISPLRDGSAGRSHRVPWLDASVFLSQ